MHVLVASMSKDGVDTIEVMMFFFPIIEFATQFQDPSRYGFGGARKGERISLKAAAVQLATAALHNRFLRFHLCHQNCYLQYDKLSQAPNEYSDSPALELPLPCVQWRA